MVKYLLVAVAGAGLALLGGWALEDAPGGEAATTRYLDIPAAGLVARYQTTHNAPVSSVCPDFAANPLTPENGIEGSGSLNDQGSYIAPVQLPGGATVNSLSLFVMDNDANDNVHVYLLRKRMSDGEGIQQGYVVMAHAASAMATASTMQKYTDTTVGSATINVQEYSYFVEYVDCSEEGNTRGVGLQIKYTTP
jgi:hypothetical protein